MKVILKTRNGYINTDNGIKICQKDNATKFSISETNNIIEKIYNEKPMIGKIQTEVIK